MQDRVLTLHAFPAHRERVTPPADEGSPRAALWALAPYRWGVLLAFAVSALAAIPGLLVAVVVGRAIDALRADDRGGLDHSVLVLALLGVVTAMSWAVRMVLVSRATFHARALARRVGPAVGRPAGGDGVDRRRPVVAVRRGARRPIHPLRAMRGAARRGWLSEHSHPRSGRLDPGRSARSPWPGSRSRSPFPSREPGHRHVASTRPRASSGHGGS
jgi:hypothetical protein